MLDEYRSVYVEQANLIPNWKKKSRNDLCREYEKLINEKPDSPLLNSYMSAIMLSFWHVLYKTYNKQPIKVLSQEDCYECLVESVLEILKKKPWEDPTQSIYQDEKGPERAINIRFQQNVINLFVAEQRHKRKLLDDAFSLDSTIEDDEEYSLLSFVEDESINLFDQLYWKQRVKQYFDKKDYITAFVLDILLTETNSIKVVNDEYEIDLKRIVRILNTELDERYCDIFSETYDVKLDDVKCAVKYLCNMDKKTIGRIVRILFNRLRIERSESSDNQ